MRKNIFYSVLVSILFSGCQNKYYTEADFLTVPKIDVHAHLNSENNWFEEQALKDNFKLLTINVDHSDSAAVKEQLKDALLAKSKYPG